jgi:ABC-2 type transport system ATP-binding protein
MSVVIDKVTKLYGEQKALNEVSFEIKTGEIVAFIGPNGAGKSTLMKIICGSLPPTAGSVFVNGMNVTDNPMGVKRAIGYLPEHNPLYLDMYVKESLEFTGGLYHVKNLKKRVDEVVEMTGLTREMHKKIGALSKGYRQRIGLAQALIHDPAILILDEPTTGLDPNQIAEIRNLISETGKSKTIMLSTHIMQEVEAICHRIIIINKGEIVANDEAKNIYSHSTSTGFTVLVEFSKPVAETEFKQLGTITDYRKIDHTVWLLSNKEGLDIREDVFKFAVSRDISILSIQKQEKRLEEIFRELTK